MVLQGAPDITNECLDILNEVITKYGSLMTQQHAQLTGALLPLLDDRRSPMRKRAIGCLGASGFFTASLTGPLVVCKHSHCVHACLARMHTKEGPSDAWAHLTAFTANLSCSVFGSDAWVLCTGTACWVSHAADCKCLASCWGN